MDAYFFKRNVILSVPFKYLFIHSALVAVHSMTYYRAEHVAEN